MCEIEDFTIGHQDIYLNKYSECLDNTMDLYITDSLQDMLDMDIKSEMATDLGSATDFSDALGLSFSDMPPLLDMDGDNSTWISTSCHNSSSFVHNLDLYGSEANAVMVNPNSVMPSIFSETPTKKIVNQNSSNLMLNSVSDLVSSSPLPSPKEEKSHLTFSPNTIRLSKLKEEPEADRVPAGQMIEATNMAILLRKKDIVKKDLISELDTKKIKITNNTTPTLRIKTSQPELIKINNKNCSILNATQKVSSTTTQLVTTQSIGTKTIISGNIHILGAQQSRMLTNGTKNQATILIDNGSLNNRQILKTAVSTTFANVVENGTHTKFVTSNKSYTNEFPKPAYSYSCLIAMALKNSRTGSLPVSEIYNFMCQHFPYFKTAPNGWKNSVRHNLSLNKCFEKIEKPSTNGGQRKGCLWAMNPTKVGKMDEEVQKWSRKDPQAIRKAMVYPDSLEALERGEMKYSGAGCNSDPELDDADMDADVELDDDVDTIDDQELSEEELGRGVSGTYRLLAPAYIADSDLSDIEVMDHTYDEIDIEDTKPLKLEFALSEEFEESSPKRAKTSFIYQPVTTTTSHASRRKTPLVNRIA